jgi:hypothetical protein
MRVKSTRWRGRVADRGQHARERSLIAVEALESSARRDHKRLQRWGGIAPWRNGSAHNERQQRRSRPELSRCSLRLA